jgi:hypothetical protein
MDNTVYPWMHIYGLALYVHIHSQWCASLACCVLLLFVVVFSQMFQGATAFSQDLSAWNVARVSNFQNMFSSVTAFCDRRLVYDAWGASFQTAFPGFSSGVCLIATGFSPLNAPASHGAAVTILGTGFGAVDASPSAYFSGQPCATTSWTSATQLICSASTPTVAGGALLSVRNSRAQTMAMTLLQVVCGARRGSR